MDFPTTSSNLLVSLSSLIQSHSCQGEISGHLGQQKESFLLVGRLIIYLLAIVRIAKSVRNFAEIISERFPEIGGAQIGQQL